MKRHKINGMFRIDGAGVASVIYLEGMDERKESLTVVRTEELERVDTALEDFKCARTAHWNATPEKRSDALTIYDDIIRRLEAVLHE